MTRASLLAEQPRSIASSPCTIKYSTGVDKTAQVLLHTKIFWKNLMQKILRNDFHSKNTQQIKIQLSVNFVLSAWLVCNHEEGKALLSLWSDSDITSEQSHKLKPQNRY